MVLAPCPVRLRPLGGLRPLRLVLMLVLASSLFAASAPAATRASRPRVVLVTYNCADNFLCPGFERALRVTGVSGRIISPDPREDPVATLSLLAAQGFDPVIVDPDHTDGLATVAKRFPRTHFLVFDRSLASMGIRLHNVQALVVEPREAAYLAGWLAARLEMRRPGPDVIGALGGFRIPSVDDFITGFAAGAKHADPNIKVLVNYSNDFVDTNKCEAIAKTQIAHGAGVLFNVAGACGLGTLAAAKQAGVWGVGVDTDQSILGSFVLTSVIKRYDAGFLKLLTGGTSGNVVTSGGTTVLGMRDGGAVLGPISPKVPAAIRVGLDRVRRQILDGRLRVPVAPER
jgi:basic membrane protein A